MIFAGFDAQNSFLIDLRGQAVLARLTPGMASDRDFWKKIIFPFLISVLSSSRGIPVLHCGCLAWKGNGLLLAGESGSGKSTLSLALAQAGFDFLSDDRAMLSRWEGRLLAWGLSPFIKLRPEASAHFPELVGLEPNDVWSGEPVFSFDPAKEFGLGRVQCSEPRWVVWLERQTDSAFSLQNYPAAELVARLEDGLPRETPQAMRTERETIEALADRDLWVLRYGGDPHAVAKSLRDILTRQLEDASPRAKSISSTYWRVPVSRPDPLRRYTPTPLAADLQMMGRTLRLETNSPTVLDQARRAFCGYAHDPDGCSGFVWRVVCEADAMAQPYWPKMRAFSDEGRRFVNLGQRGFIALDLFAREAVAYLATEWTTDEFGFSNVFFPTLFDLTAGALGLTLIYAGCVALGGNGLLMFGPPQSGKATSGYLAEKAGLEFLADDATFLELKDGMLRAWGQFWPARFRPEAERFLPELPQLGQCFAYDGITILSMAHAPFALRLKRSVSPVVCVFLERGTADSPRLIPLSSREFLDRLRDSFTYLDDARFAGERAEVVGALAELPAYRLAYGSDPALAAALFRSLLSSPCVVGGRG